MFEVLFYEKEDGIRPAEDYLKRTKSEENNYEKI